MKGTTSIGASDQIKRSDVEIMAPAGSFENLWTAIHAGANSIYFGAPHLNMRSRSSANFSMEDLAEIARICKDHQVKSYLTLNVVMYDGDLPLMRQIVDKAKEAGIDAVIASDIAAIQYAYTQGVEIHISTQLNVSNYQGVKFFAQYADVIVLARELNLDQVKEIYAQIQRDQLKGPGGELIRIEMFCHGALCMAVSGKCYLSLHNYGHSANRGTCLQGCRRSYIVKDKESDDELEIDHEYIMSPKDLCTIGFMDRMLDAGVRVFKIEGRARSAEYVHYVVQSYHQAITSVLDGTYSRSKIDGWMEKLSQVFNRGFWDGYYLGQRLGEWSEAYGSVAKKKKIYAGKVTNYFSKIKVAEITIEACVVKSDDTLLIIGPTTGYMEIPLTELRNAGGYQVEVLDKAVGSVQVPERVRRADKVFVWR